jgi:hypothetical protein
MLVCDYIADPTEFAANLGPQDDLMIRRNINPARFGGNISGLVKEYIPELDHFQNVICGTGILPYDFNPKSYLDFRDAVDKKII